MLPLGQQHRMRPDGPTVGHLAIAREEMASCAFGKILQGRDWNLVERSGVWASGPIARLAFETETIDDEAIAYVRTSLPGSSGGNECRIRVNGAEAGAIGLSPGLQAIRVPTGRGGRVHIELALAQEERAPGDLRRLGLGLHRVSVCRTADLATRVSFLEER